MAISNELSPLWYDGSQVAIIGLGPVGLSWAALFLSRGFAVQGFDVLDKAREEARSNIAAHLTLLLGDEAPGDIAAMLSRFSAPSSMEAAVERACWVQENVVECVDVKSDVFGRIGEAAPGDAIMASSTSELPGSSFLQDMEGRSRALIAHPINPPHIIPLVELCPTPFTTTETVAVARRFMEDIGQTPIVLRRELPGYIANRLQIALLGEAMRLVDEGWCSATDIDAAVRNGIGLRWAAVGPFEAGHLNSAGGAAEYFAKYRPAMRNIMTLVNPDFDYDDAFLEQVEKDLRASRPNSVGEGQALRDQQLIELRAARGDHGKRLLGKIEAAGGDRR